MARPDEIVGNRSNRLPVGAENRHSQNETIGRPRVHQRAISCEGLTAGRGVAWLDDDWRSDGLQFFRIEPNGGESVLLLVDERSPREKRNRYTFHHHLRFSRTMCEHGQVIPDATARDWYGADKKCSPGKRRETKEIALASGRIGPQHELRRAATFRYAIQPVG